MSVNDFYLRSVVYCHEKRDEDFEGDRLVRSSLLFLSVSMAPYVSGDLRTELLYCVLGLCAVY